MRKLIKITLTLALKDEIGFVVYNVCAYTIKPKSVNIFTITLLKDNQMIQATYSSEEQNHAVVVGNRPLGLTVHLAEPATEDTVINICLYFFPKGTTDKSEENKQLLRKNFATVLVETGSTYGYRGISAIHLPRWSKFYSDNLPAGATLEAK